MAQWNKKLVVLEIKCPDCGILGRRVCNPDEFENWMNYCPQCSWKYYD